ncbi:MAG: hypothetical protein ABJE95_38915 [Byssovorax sp.]
MSGVGAPTTFIGKSMGVFSASERVIAAPMCGSGAPGMASNESIGFYRAVAVLEGALVGRACGW